MKTAVIMFPGSNCDRDMAVALEAMTGRAPVMVWHKETALPAGTEFAAIPGGFSHGDYLRSGAMAARSPVMNAVRSHAATGRPVLGVCNGFQILCEAGLLPGALMRNAGLDFICRSQTVTVESGRGLLGGLERGEALSLPVAHHDGNYQAAPEVLDRLRSDDRIAFRYRGACNGSADDIAGILSEGGNLLGMMPHPERAMGGHEGGSDGRELFAAMLDALAAA